MSEFHDPELRQQLGRLSGPYPDDNVAFAAWQRRVGQARRRRTVAWSSGAALSLILATVSVAALQNPARNSVVPGESSETSADLTVGIATTERDETSTTELIALPTMPANTLASDTTASTEPAVETSPPQPEVTEPAGSQTSGQAPNGSGNGSDLTPAPQTSATPQTATKTVKSVGGTVTVRQDGDRLIIAGLTPTAGFQAHESDQSEGSDHRVKVTFSSGNHTSEISFTLYEGIIRDNVSERSDSHEESAPTTTGDNRDGESRRGDSD